MSDHPTPPAAASDFALAQAFRELVADRFLRSSHQLASSIEARAAEIDATQAAQPSGVAGECIGYIHEVVWPDGTQRSFSVGVPMTMAEVEKRDGIPVHHVSERYWPIHDPDAPPIAQQGGVEALLSDTVGNLRRMAADEFADCNLDRLNVVIERLKAALASKADGGES